MNDLRNIKDINIKETEVMYTPKEIQEMFPLSKGDIASICSFRKEISDIIQGKDPRKVVVVGPCSIHDSFQAIEYAQFLLELREKYKKTLLIVMRCYVEKPRTTVGWKGILNDPDINGRCDINKGIKITRKLLLDITRLGIPIASEVVNAITLQYISNLFSLVSIGARTVTSQPHRELASGLSVPVGFKNSLSGNINVAIDGIKTGQSPHSFIGINIEGQVAIFRTSGNPDAHLILRGSDNGVNFDQDSIDKAAKLMLKAGISPSILIDCSHGNSEKDFRNQKKVIHTVLKHPVKTLQAVKGFMLESNLKNGNQKISDHLEYGVSITDSCISVESTATLLQELHEFLSLNP